MAKSGRPKPVPQNPQPPVVPAGDILRAKASVVREKLRKGRQVLKVFFMNPEVLEGWKCEGKEMTTEKIKEWAGAWKKASPPPEFTETESVYVGLTYESSFQVYT